MEEQKSFGISKRSIWEAWKKVKANQGAAGADEVTIAQFEARLSDNLYKVWNRMASGSYFPPSERHGHPQWVAPEGAPPHRLSGYTPA